MPAHHLRLVSFLLVALPALGSTAGATVGGPSTIEVLGFDPGDAKVYVLEHHHDESGDLPQLSFWALMGAPAGGRVRVRSWYAGDAAAADASFPQRLATLRARLQPLPARGGEGVELRVQEWEVRPCTQQQIGATPAQQKAATELQRGKPFRPQVELPSGPHGEPAGTVSMCRILHVDVRWGAHRAEATLESWGGLQLVSAYVLPRPHHRLVVLRHLGHTHETGYAADVPLLLHAAPADATEAEPASPTAARHAACAVGLRHLRPVGDPPQAAATPGRWARALTPDELGFERWARATLHAHQLGERAVRLLEVHQGDNTFLIVGAPQVGGGVCVLGTWGMQFGGLGVQGEVTRAVASGDGRMLAVIHRADALYRGYHDDGDRFVSPKEERRWTALLVSAAGVRALEVPSVAAERLEAYWGGPGGSATLELKAVDGDGKVVWSRVSAIER